MVSLKYIIIILFGGALLSHGYYTLWKIRKQLHMLQLNSYFNRRYVAWLRRRQAIVISWQELAPFLATLGALFHLPLITLLLLILIYVRLFLARPRRQEKKPLVFTPRALRLLILNIIVLAGVYIGIGSYWWYQGDLWLMLLPLVLVGSNILVPLFLLGTNFILSPLEKGIQYWYFRDGQRKVRQLPNLKVIGITGSFGKTTTKYVVTKLLRQKFTTLMTPASYNTTMGVTKVIRTQLKATTELMVVEMSAKKVGDIKELCQLVRPQYGIITAIGEQHLETFKTLENIKYTKNELITALPPEGIAFLNMDDLNCRELARLAKVKVIQYGVVSQDLALDYWVSDWRVEASGSRFTVVRRQDQSAVTFTTKLLGIHNIQNILGAIAVAAELGVELREMVYPVKQLVAVPHRLELKPLAGNITYIDDAFNANPVGSQRALEVLQQMAGRRKIIVTPGLVELGAKEEQYNEQFGAAMAASCDYVILVGVEQTAAIRRGLGTKNYPAQTLYVAPDFTAAKQHLAEIVQSGDVVLFENDLPDNYNE